MVVRFNFFCLLFCAVLVLPAISVQGQSQQKVLLQIDTLRSLLAKADTLSPFTNYEDESDPVGEVNEAIREKLTAILQSPAVIKMNIDSLLKHESLYIARSKDKRLWIISWYENTGGSFHSYLSLVHYRTASGKAKVFETVPANEEDVVEWGSPGEQFYSMGLAYDTVYPLNAMGRNLYLCIGSAKTCNTCFAVVAVVVELTKDSILFDYPAFENPADPDLPKYSPSFLLESRIGNIEYFKFDSETQTLSFRYTTDDNTPVKGEGEKVITRKLKFDGKKFLGNGYQ